jgi:hypothetical protein
MNVMLLVMLIVLGVVVVQVAMWIPIIIWIRRKSARALAELASEVAALEDERLVAGPEKGTYRGSSGGHGKVKGNGVIVLTDRRLVFRKLLGASVEVPVHTITGTKRSRSFLWARSGGATHLIVTTTEPAEVGFYVKDLDAWQRHLDAVRPAPRSDT